MVDISKVHIGRIIETVAREKKMTPKEIGDKMNRSDQAIRNIFHNPDINTANLTQLCEILEYNFFKHFSTRCHQEVDYGSKMVMENAEASYGNQFSGIVNITLDLKKMLDRKFFMIYLKDTQIIS